MSPNARSLAHLRLLGYLAAPVERWLPHVNRHVDLFRIADCIGVHPRDRQVLLVQATSAAHVGDRLRRVQGRPETRQLLEAGVAVEVWGWALRAGRWQVRRVAVQAADLAAVEVQALPRRQRGRKAEQRGLFDLADDSAPLDAADAG